MEIRIIPFLLLLLYLCLRRSLPPLFLVSLFFVRSLIILSPLFFDFTLMNSLTKNLTNICKNSTNEPSF